MKWYEKFKVGQKVKITKKVINWRYTSWGIIGWNDEMDKTVNKVYKIVQIDKHVGYQLLTEKEVNYNFWYPAASLSHVGRQLLFDFMY